jgi:hypothetical protein
VTRARPWHREELAVDHLDHHVRGRVPVRLHDIRAEVRKLRIQRARGDAHRSKECINPVRVRNASDSARPIHQWAHRLHELHQPSSCPCRTAEDPSPNSLAPSADPRDPSSDGLPDLLDPCHALDPLRARRPRSPRDPSPWHAYPSPLALIAIAKLAVPIHRRRADHPKTHRRPLRRCWANSA